MPTTEPNDEIEMALVAAFMCGIQSDFLSKEEIQHRIAGFKHTKWYKEPREAIQRLIVEARIDTATDILYGFSRTYKQEVTDSEGNVYVSDSHGYISKYEVQEFVTELKCSLENKQKEE